MKRRHFLASLGSLPVGSVLVAATPPPTVAPARDRRAGDRRWHGRHHRRDSGGPARREDDLVEAGGQLGGTTTTGGVDFPGLFHAWGKQVIAGHRLGTRPADRGAEQRHACRTSRCRPAGSTGGTRCGSCGALYAALAEEACVQAGVNCAITIAAHRRGSGRRLARAACGQGHDGRRDRETARRLHRQRDGGRAGGLRADAGGNAPAGDADLPRRRLRYCRQSTPNVLKELPGESTPRQ